MDYMNFPQYDEPNLVIGGGLGRLDMNGPTMPAPKQVAYTPPVASYPTFTPSNPHTVDTTAPTEIQTLDANTQQAWDDLQRLKNWVQTNPGHPQHAVYTKMYEANLKQYQKMQEQRIKLQALYDQRQRADEKHKYDLEMLELKKKAAAQKAGLADVGKQKEPLGKPWERGGTMEAGGKTYQVPTETSASAHSEFRAFGDSPEKQGPWNYNTDIKGILKNNPLPMDAYTDIAGIPADTASQQVEKAQLLKDLQAKELLRLTPPKVAKMTPEEKDQAKAIRIFAEADNRKKAQEAKQSQIYNTMTENVKAAAIATGGKTAYSGFNPDGTLKFAKQYSDRRTKDELANMALSIANTNRMNIETKYQEMTKGYERPAQAASSGVTTPPASVGQKAPLSSATEQELQALSKSLKGKRPAAYRAVIEEITRRKSAVRGPVSMAEPAMPNYEIGRAL